MAATPSSTSDDLQAALEILLNGPASPPPVGVTPNLDNPPNQQVPLHIAVVLTLSFSTCAVIIRIYTKRFVLRTMGYEDYASILAWISFIVFAVPALLCQKSGAGLHMWDLRLKSFFRVLYWVNLTAVTYAIAMTFAKLSILLQYLRIFAPSRSGAFPLFLAIHTCIWSLTIFYVVDTFFLIFLCTPREKIWNPLMTGGHCFDSNASYKASGVFNVLSDFAILIVPMPTLWRLQMSLKKKLLTMGVFATGLLACVASILRTYYTWQTVESRDTSWMLIPMGYWTWTELSVGIIVGCLPTMPKFFQYIGPKIRRRIMGTGPGHESSAESEAPKVNVVAKFQRPFAKYGLGLSVSDSRNDSYHTRAQPGCEYVTLDEFNPSPRQVSSYSESTEYSSKGAATMRDDLEYGQNNFDFV